MTVDSIERLHYYQRQYLGAEDFEAQQAYHRDMRRRHNLAHHTWGIVAGLELVQEPKDGAAAGVMDVYIQPGFAIDGFGREIIVLQPYKLDPDLFHTPPGEQYREVWIAHDEEYGQRPSPGYELCDNGSQFGRVLETFRIVIDPRQPTHDPVQVAGEPVYPPSPANTSNGLVIPYDESVPYQEFPDENANPRWPVQLGSVKLDGNSGQFIEAAVSRLSEGRRYVGSVAAEVTAPDGDLHIRDRGTPSPLPASEDGVTATVEGSLLVQRKAGIGTAQPDVRLHVDNGTDAGLADGSGYVVIGPLNGGNLVLDNNEIMARNNGAKSPLHFQADGGDLIVHNNQADSRFVVKDSGNVGIGVSNPGAKLQITGGSDASFDNGSGYLVIGSENAANIVLDDNEMMARNNGAKSTLHFQAEGGDLYVHSKKAGTAFIVKDSGNVGVGTSSPNAKLQITGGSDASLISGTGAIVIGEESGENIVIDNNEMIARNNGAKSSLYFQAEGGDLIVHAHQAGAQQFVVKDSGRVGVGTASPAVELDVNGTVRASEIRTTLHTASGTNSVALSNSNAWGDFPQLSVTFSLSAPTNVLIFYQITMPGDDSHLVTRLAIDGAVQARGRAISGNTAYWSPSSTWMGLLDTGSHTIKVQYRTPHGGTNDPGGTDWHSRILQVLVFGS